MTHQLTQVGADLAFSIDDFIENVFLKYAQLFLTGHFSHAGALVLHNSFPCWRNKMCVLISQS